MPGALTKRDVETAKPRSGDYFVWCGKTSGFGVRIYPATAANPTGKKVFIAQVRVGRATRRVKIGAFGPFTVEQARKRAEEVIRMAAAGQDPQREKRDTRQALTIAELCEEYLTAARAGLVLTRFRRAKRPATVAIDEGRIARHIVPLIGSILARDLKRSDVQRMADDIAKGKTSGVFKGKPRGRAVVTGGAGTAARVVELLGGIYTWAAKRDLVPAVTPTRGVDRMRGETKDRVLSAEELAALGKAIDANEQRSPLAAGALRLIALTGLRREEACGLRWSEIDADGFCLRLEATKTGRSTRPIGKAAREFLRALPRLSDEWVFPSRKGNGSATLKNPIADMFDVAGLADVRSQTLRRTFASIAADEGYSDATIGELLGHSRRGVTARHYIRRPDAALIAAADRVSAHISAAMSGSDETHENIIPLRAVGD
jgi:integrase